MTDYEKPTGFTAVNGRHHSPPRSHPMEPFKDRETGTPHGLHISTNGIGDARNTPASDGKSASSAQHHSYGPSSAETDAAKMESASAGAERSPTRKRTYPEAFDDSNVIQQYPPRSAPPREGQGQEYRSAEGHQSALVHAQYNGGPVQAGSPYSTDPGLDETDRRTMEALKANSGSNSPPREHYSIHEIEDDDDDNQGDGGDMMSSLNTPTRTAAGVITKDSAKRKRVFSNRTKTGCLTCRKRKKKCDEKHPECANCLRGGFVCEGYTPRASWQKPNQNHQPRAPPLAQIQSKGPGMGPIRQHSLHYPDTPQDFARPELRHEEHRIDLTMPGGPQLPHPQEQMRQPYPRPDGRFPQQGLNPRYEPDSREHNMHNGPRHEPRPYPPPPPAAAFPSQQPGLHHGAPPAPMHHGVPVNAVAKAALEHVPQTLPPASSLVNGSPMQPMAPRRPGEMSERDKMMQGDYYLPYTASLNMDRNACAAAIYRFNQACQNPSLNFLPLDRERLFRDVVGCRPHVEQPCPSPVQNGRDEDQNMRTNIVIPRGSIGTGCVIEAPFQCDYGYNLTIGSDVVIGANCKIADTCSVSIGNGAVLSPGVTLMCSTYGIDPKERRKGLGRALARGIVIEEEAWIGTNVTILPGVRVGKCSTVGAGSMIHKDVPPFTVVAGNPSKVVRGIGSNDEERD